MIKATYLNEHIFEENLHCEPMTLPEVVSYPVSGKHNFKHGQDVTGLYKLAKVPCVGCEAQYGCYNWQIGDCRGSDATMAAIPIESTPKNNDVDFSESAVNAYWY